MHKPPVCGRAWNSLNLVGPCSWGTGIGGWGLLLGAGALKHVLVLNSINHLLTQLPPELITHGWPEGLPPCLLPAHIRVGVPALRRGLCPQDNVLSGHLWTGGEQGPGKVPALSPSSPQAGALRVGGGARLPDLLRPAGQPV